MWTLFGYLQVANYYTLPSLENCASAAISRGWTKTMRMARYDGPEYAYLVGIVSRFVLVLMCTPRG